MGLTELFTGIRQNYFNLHRFLSEWGEASKFPQFKAKLVENATEGFIALFLVAGGLVLALVFEKRMGWLLVLVGIGLLVRLSGFV